MYKILSLNSYERRGNKKDKKSDIKTDNRFLFLLSFFVFFYCP
jgi:hypothetical protein